METQPETSKEKRSFADHFERLWSQALVAVSNAEDEALKVVQRLAESAGWSPEEMRLRARELTERLASQRKDVEHGLDEAVKRTLTRLKVPKREQVQEVQARLNRLAERVERL